jgi:hypothetical protein
MSELITKQKEPYSSIQIRDMLNRQIAKEKN